MAPQAADSWQQMAAMPTVRYSHASAVMDGKIYVSGGFTTLGELSDAFEAYDPVTNTWATLASLSEARADHASAAFNRKLYVFGGFTSSGDCLDLVEAACTYTDSNTALRQISGHARRVCPPPTKRPWQLCSECACVDSPGALRPENYLHRNWPRFHPLV